MLTFRFEKLIRDKILQLHLDVGHDVTYRRVSGDELKEKLRIKLIEEANEIPVRESVDNEIIEELADVQQVIDDLKRLYDVTDHQVAEMQLEKHSKKGGFTDGVYIEKVTLPESDEWVAYYRRSPEKYPEVANE